MSEPNVDLNPEHEEPMTETADQAAETVEHDFASLVGKLTDERDLLQGQLLRAAADFQNFRKRVQQEKDQLRQFAIEGFVSDLLPVLDNFERTLAAIEAGATLEGVVEGVTLISRQLQTALEQHNVKRIPSMGQMFDPALHEAIEMEPSEDAEPDTITAELQAGYRLADRVIRPARVKVAQRS